MEIMLKRNGRRPSISGAESMKLPIKIEVPGLYNSAKGLLSWVVLPRQLQRMVDRVPIVLPNHPSKLKWDMALGVLIFWR